nr:immunoglobulin heavy chain junction region [Macaca mulatta]
CAKEYAWNPEVVDFW